MFIALHQRATPQVSLTQFEISVCSFLVTAKYLVVDLCRFDEAFDCQFVILPSQVDSTDIKEGVCDCLVLLGLE